MSKQEVYDSNWYRQHVKKDFDSASLDKKLAMIRENKHASIKGRPSMNDNPVLDSMKIILSQDPAVGICGCEITLVGLAPGLNGSSGLMREHWTKGVKRRDAYVIRIKALGPIPMFFTPVRVIYTRYTSSFMDWDNCGASWKKLGDAIVISGILSDDGPDVIKEFIPKQVKCKRKDQHTEILIEQL